MNLTEYYTQKKIQGGDIREFEDLFHRYYEPLCRFAFRIVNDMEMAEDIVQDFFYNLWKNHATLSFKLSFKAYLYHSIRNNALHYLEHLEIRKNYAETVIAESAAQMAGDDSPELGVKELSRIVDETLMQLPERCSLIFRMNRFQGMKYREIAESLSISVKTVEAEMGKALRFFREALKDYRKVATGT